MIKIGALIEKKNGKGLTPLHLAALNNNTECLQLLIEKGAKINSQTKNGKFTKEKDETPTEERENLLEKGRTSLYLSVLQGNYDCARILLESGANIDLKLDESFTPLFACVIKCCDEENKKNKENLLKCIDLLLQKGADIQVRGKKNQAAIHIAAARGQPDILRKLIKYDKNCNFADEDSETPLHKAVIGGNLECVELLLDPENFPMHNQVAKIPVCYSVTTKNLEGCTPLYLAAKNGRAKILDFLIKEGGDIDDKNYAGISPLQIAETKGHNDCVKILQNAMIRKN